MEQPAPLKIRANPMPTSVLFGRWFAFWARGLLLDCVYRVERRSGIRLRSIALPSEVNEDEVVAEYIAGMLTITLPTVEQAKARKIKVWHEPWNRR